MRTERLRPKKPIYKRIWFWLLVVVIVLGVGGALGSGSNGGQKVGTNSASTPKYYKLGDTVKVGKVTYTLKSVELTDERNEFADDKPNNVIKVTYHVKNGSDDSIPVGADLNAYGPDKNKLKTYPVNGQTLDAIDAGMETDVVTGFGINKLGKVQLKFAPLVSSEKPATYQVNVK